MPPRVSIIITTRNRAEHLREALASFQRLRVPQDLPAELLVVDNASTDDTAEVVKSTRLAQLPVRYLHEPKPGQSNARNSGVRSTVGNVILFTDDDVRVPADWLLKMATPIGLGALAVAGGVEIAPRLLRSWMDQTHKDWLASSDSLDNMAPKNFIGANMGFSRKVFEIVPTFDPKLGPGALGFGDETLFAKQLTEAGINVCPNFGARIEHHFEPERLTRRAFLRAARARGASKAYIAYHWEYSLTESSVFQVIKRRLALELWRFRNQLPKLSDEGCPTDELLLAMKYAFISHMWHYRNTPKMYERRGLVRLHS